MQLGSGLEPGITGLVKVTFFEVDAEVLASTVLRRKIMSLQRIAESMQCSSRRICWFLANVLSVRLQTVMIISETAAEIGGAGIHFSRLFEETHFVLTEILGSRQICRTDR